MLCNITQNAMGQTTGGGVPISHDAFQHYPECHGVDTGGVPSQVQLGCTQLGGPLPGRYPARGYPAGGVPYQGVPCWEVPLARTGVLCWGVPR